MESWPQRHRITVDEYHRMAEVGLLAPDARVELIEGEIIDMAPIGKEHTSVVDQLNRLFVRAVGDDAIVRVQGSVRLGRMSEPEAWIVDVPNDRLLVYGALDAGEYRSQTVLERPGRMAVAALPGITMDLSTVFA